ncbi:hypothetical protein RRG08_024203 [Elysia crispata]|uniref:Uncharacterized protein n=1 Tax=Elysia crispata TaxID=231223 RepID=A0AAE1D2Q4_9GAST|nr:hypothetical protein RRG08_024203 [Elysia crispata]
MGEQQTVLGSCVTPVKVTVMLLLVCAETSIFDHHKTLIRDCMHLPRIPLHALYTVRGSFKAVLKCADSKRDISLNGPGTQGVLVCSPHSDINYDFDNMWMPQCNLRKTPAKIKITGRFVYMLHACDAKTMAAIEFTIRNLTKTYFMDVHEPCGTKKKLCNGSVQFFCGISGMKHLANYRYQFEAQFQLTTDYNPSQGLNVYRNVAQDIRRRAGCDTYGQLERVHRAMWEVGHSHLAYVYVSSWRGTCEEHANSLGTDLEVDGVLTCRGCSEKYFLNNEQCLPCPYNHYSESFAASCKRCPDESLWIDRLKLEDLCYIRP